MSATLRRYPERWPRFDLIRVESSFQNEATGYVPVERLDVLLTLGPSIVACEVSERIIPVYPLTRTMSSQFNPSGM
jgi:hypothetical protein